MSTPSLVTAERYLILYQRYLQAPTKAEFDEYKALDLQFALRGWNVSAVKNFVRKACLRRQEQEKCTSAQEQ